MQHPFVTALWLIALRLASNSPIQLDLVVWLERDPELLVMLSDELEQWESFFPS